jgi:zinc protease
VKAITLDDIKAYHRQHFAANQAKLVIAGDVDPEAIVVLLESVLGTWKTKADKPVARPASPIKLQKRVIYLVDRPGSVQSNLRIGRVWTDRNDPSYYATSIGNHVFGVDFLSRLNRNLRERNGFTYGAGSTFVYRRSGSVWVASSSVRSDATAPALREMISELDGIAGKSPLSDEEAKLGRDALTQSFPESFEDLSSIAGVLESMAENSLPADYLSNYLNKIANVSTTDAREVFRKLASSDERTILVVGDRKTIEPKLKALNLGEVKVIDADGKPIAK